MRASIAAILVLLLPAPFPNDPEKEVAFHWIEQNAATTRKVSLNIWSNPELALREFKSSRELIHYLQQRIPRGEGRCRDFDVLCGQLRRRQTRHRHLWRI